LIPYYEQDGITIYHGDCREILPSIGPVDLLLTDPPYGIALKSHGTRFRGMAEIVGDGSTQVGQLVCDWAEESAIPTVVFASPMKPWQGRWRQHLVWDKGGAVGIGGDRATCWKQSWELVQVARTGKLSGQRDEAVLRFHVNSKNSELHPAAKPVELIRHLLWKVGGASIFDPFMGSGTTLCAAKDLGRKAIGIEIEERYCEIAAKRLQQSVMALEIPA
jgi:DNA modification methylase